MQTLVQKSFSWIWIDVLNHSSIFHTFKPFSPAKTTFHAELCNPITCQAIELESCSNPLRIQQVL